MNERNPRTPQEPGEPLRAMPNQQAEPQTQTNAEQMLARLATQAHEIALLNTMPNELQATQGRTKQIGSAALMRGLNASTEQIQLPPLSAIYFPTACGNVNNINDPTYKNPGRQRPAKPRAITDVPTEQQPAQPIRAMVRIEPITPPFRYTRNIITITPNPAVVPFGESPQEIPGAWGQCFHFNQYHNSV